MPPNGHLNVRFSKAVFDFGTQPFNTHRSCRCRKTRGGVINCKGTWRTQQYSKVVHSNIAAEQGCRKIQVSALYSCSLPTAAGFATEIRNFGNWLCDFYISEVLFISAVQIWLLCEAGGYVCWEPLLLRSSHISWMTCFLPSSTQCFRSLRWPKQWQTQLLQTEQWEKAATHAACSMLCSNPTSEAGK